MSRKWVAGGSVWCLRWIRGFWLFSWTRRPVSMFVFESDHVRHPTPGSATANIYRPLRESCDDAKSIAQTCVAVDACASASWKIEFEVSCFFESRVVPSLTRVDVNFVCVRIELNGSKTFCMLLITRSVCVIAYERVFVYQKNNPENKFRLISLEFVPKKIVPA